MSDLHVLGRGRRFAHPPHVIRAGPVRPAEEPVASGEAHLPMHQQRSRPARLLLFGGPEVLLPDRSAVGLTPTHEALLTLVWGHEQQGVTRRTAIGLLWEEDDTSRSRHRLSQALHEIRARVGVDPFAHQGEDLLLPAWDALASDLGEVREALRTGALQRAQAIEARGFAPRLRRIPGEAYADWLEAKRAGLRRELREVSAAAWDRHYPRGEWKLAREAAEVLHALQPSSEAALRKVVESRAMTGGFEAAEAAYAAFMEAAAELGPPEAETLALVERIRRLVGERELGPPHDKEPPPPLVGRTRHLETARAFLDRVRGGGFHFLLLRGESGLGKTRLLEEIRREAHIKGFRCLEARPVELEHRIPLNPLVDALGHPAVAPHLRDLEDPWRSVIAGLLPSLPPGVERSEVPLIQESSLSRRLFDAFHMLFTSLAEDEPTLLFIDDLQWADATTIATLQFMQRRWASGSLGVISTVRPDLIAGEEGPQAYLKAGGDLAVTPIAVEELGGAEAAELVRHVSEGGLDARTVRKLCALGGHNPFYLIELTRDHMGGRLQLPELPSDALIVPISLRQLVGPRIAALGPGAAQALGALAAFGRWTALTDLAAVSGDPLERCLAHVEELERHRLVVTDRDQVRITHELFRGAVYHGLSESRRAVLHRRIADHLVACDHASPGELAVHFARAGDRAQAARYGREAADAALESGATAEATHFLELVMENEHDERLRALATGDLARVLHMKRDIARADGMLELAAERLRGVGESAAATRLDIRRIEALAELGTVSIDELLVRLQTLKDRSMEVGDDEAWALALDAELNLLERVGRTEEISVLFSEIRVCSRSPDPRAACIASSALAIQVFFGAGEEALSHARRAVELAEHGLAQYLFLAHTRLHMVLYSRGLSRSEEAVRSLERARDAAARSGDVGLRFRHLVNQGVAEMDAGYFERAHELFAQAELVLTGAHDELSRVTLHLNRGELAFLTLDYEAMAAHYRAAEDILRSRCGSAVSAPIATAGVGLAALELGRMEEARRCEQETLPVPGDWCFDPYIYLCFHARLLERRGRPAEALGLLEFHAAALTSTLPNTALKLMLLLVKTARRHRDTRWPSIAQEGVELAEYLGFENWSQELRRLATDS